jgi:hypothetical protein
VYYLPLLGGKDNFSVDRLMAARLAQIYWPLVEILGENRQRVPG